MGGQSNGDSGDAGLWLTGLLVVGAWLLVVIAWLLIGVVGAVGVSVSVFTMCLACLAIQSSCSAHNCAYFSLPDIGRDFSNSLFERFDLRCPQQTIQRHPHYQQH